MKNYTTKYYEQIEGKLFIGKSLLYFDIRRVNVNHFSYYLFRNGYETFIIDNYPNVLNNKESLLEALLYEMKLFGMFDLNWDSFQEGLELKTSVMSNNCIIIFSDEKKLRKVKEELEILREITEDLNLSLEDNQKIQILVGKLLDE